MNTADFIENALTGRYSLMATLAWMFIVLFVMAIFLRKAKWWARHSISILLVAVATGFFWLLEELVDLPPTTRSLARLIVASCTFASSMKISSWIAPSKIEIMER